MPLRLATLWPGDWEVILDVVEVLRVKSARPQRAMLAAKVLVVIARRVTNKVLQTHVGTGEGSMGDWEWREPGCVVTLGVRLT